MLDILYLLVGLSFMEPMYFAGKPLFSSHYFHIDRPRHVMTVATRITSGLVKSLL